MVIWGILFSEFIIKMRIKNEENEEMKIMNITNKNEKKNQTENNRRIQG